MYVSTTEHVAMDKFCIQNETGSIFGWVDAHKSSATFGSCWWLFFYFRMLL